MTRSEKAMGTLILALALGLLIITAVPGARHAFVGFLSRLDSAEVSR